VSASLAYGLRLYARSVCDINSVLETVSGWYAIQIYLLNLLTYILTRCALFLWICLFYMNDCDVGYISVAKMCNSLHHLLAVISSLPTWWLKTTVIWSTSTLHFVVYRIYCQLKCRKITFCVVTEVVCGWFCDCWCICSAGPSARVFLGAVDKAADSAHRDNCSDPVEGIVVVSLYQPACILLAQGQWRVFCFVMRT